jgi:hypothetical protein
MLAADLVGPTGEVVAIDSNAEVLSILRRCARAAGRYPNVLFHETRLEDFVVLKRDDLVIGRHILMHQKDPAAFIRMAASHMRPGGVIALYETAFKGEYRSRAPFQLMQLCRDWTLAAYNSILKRPDAAGQMSGYFSAAGFRRPTMFRDAVASHGPRAPLYPWIALTVRSLLRKIVRIGASNAACRHRNAGRSSAGRGLGRERHSTVPVAVLRLGKTVQFRRSMRQN